MERRARVPVACWTGAGAGATEVHCGTVGGVGFPLSRWSSEPQIPVQAKLESLIDNFEIFTQCGGKCAMELEWPGAPTTNPLGATEGQLGRSE